MRCMTWLAISVRPYSPRAPAPGPCEIRVPRIIVNRVPRIRCRPSTRDVNHRRGGRRGSCKAQRLRCHQIGFMARSNGRPAARAAAHPCRYTRARRGERGRVRVGLRTLRCDTRYDTRTVRYDTWLRTRGCSVWSAEWRVGGVQAMCQQHNTYLGAAWRVCELV